jgi:hypothetical protein
VTRSTKRREIRRVANRCARRSAAALSLIVPGWVGAACIYAFAVMSLSKYEDRPWQSIICFEVAALVSASPLLVALAYSARYWRLIYRLRHAPTGHQILGTTPWKTLAPAVALCGFCVLSFVMVFLVALALGDLELVLALPEIFFGLPAIVVNYFS